MWWHHCTRSIVPYGAAFQKLHAVSLVIDVDEGWLFRSALRRLIESSIINKKLHGCNNTRH